MQDMALPLLCVYKEPTAFSPLKIIFIIIICIYLTISATCLRNRFFWSPGSHFSKTAAQTIKMDLKKKSKLRNYIQTYRYKCNLESNIHYDALNQCEWIKCACKTQCFLPIKIKCHISVCIFYISKYLHIFS